MEIVVLSIKGVYEPTPELPLRPSDCVTSGLVTGRAVEECLAVFHSISSVMTGLDVLVHGPDVVGATDVGRIGTVGVNDTAGVFEERISGDLVATSAGFAAAEERIGIDTLGPDELTRDTITLLALCTPDDGSIALMIVAPLDGALLAVVTTDKGVCG